MNACRIAGRKRLVALAAERNFVRAGYSGGKLLVMTRAVHDWLAKVDSRQLAKRAAELGVTVRLPRPKKDFEA